MKRILVTGGAGFIGSAVVRHIIEATGDSVVVVDKLTYAGNLESLAVVADSERYAFEQVDICDRAELDRVFAHYQPDVVMHGGGKPRRSLYRRPGGLYRDQRGWHLHYTGSGTPLLAAFGGGEEAVFPFPSYLHR